MMGGRHEGVGNKKARIFPPRSSRSKSHALYVCVSIHMHGGGREMKKKEEL